MNSSTPGLPVHHQLPEFTQTHVHPVGDAIQPSHPRSSPSPPALNLSQLRVFSNESALHIRWPKYWSFSFNISPSNEHPRSWFSTCSHRECPQGGSTASYPALVPLATGALVEVLILGRRIDGMCQRRLITSYPLHFQVLAKLGF